MTDLRSRLTRSSFVPSKGKRLTEWLSIVSLADLSVGATTQLIVASFSAASLATIFPFTIIRVRGIVTVRVAAASTQSFGALGLAVVTEQARAAGAASLPGPMTNSSGEQWLMYQALMSNTGTVLDSRHMFVYEIDSKAMRKVEDNEAIVLMVENGGSATFRVAVNLRILGLVA